MVTKLSQLLPLAQDAGEKKLSVACPYDSHTLRAVEKARSESLIEVALIGQRSKIERNAFQCGISLDNYEIIDSLDDDNALEAAVRKVSSGRADILMKGLISSERYLKAVLNRNSGLLTLDSTISHIGIIENKNLDRLLIFGDAAVLPEPDFKQKLRILNSLVKMAERLYIDNPKVALIAATELVSMAIKAGHDAAIISKMSERGQLGCIVDGPLGLDVAINKEAAEIKEVRSVIQGDADCLIFPNIEAGNAFYKANTKIADSNVASILAGVKCPVILTSRADSIESKYYSILLALATGVI
ncbi:MAG: phosphate butyryltransferase [Bacteroidales bacterium]|nr:phosphate butyryltransferase [Bacteroidales bacterium]